MKNYIGLLILLAAFCTAGTTPEAEVKKKAQSPKSSTEAPKKAPRLPPPPADPKFEAMADEALKKAKQVVAESGDTDPKVIFNRGVAFFRIKKYAEAALHFHVAWSMRPSWKLCLNIGKAYEAANNYELAIYFCRKYLRDGGTNIPGARANEIHAEIEKLQLVLSKRRE